MYRSNEVSCKPVCTCRWVAFGLALTLSATFHMPADAQIWRGLTVADEYRCSPYDKDDYRYSQSVERKIVKELGDRIYSPYTDEWFVDTGLTDIEHIVARSEAHDSGLCEASPERKRVFASDLLNLTLASPTLNRMQKSDKDAAEWIPEKNRCWFANRVVLVRLRYDLTIDAREAVALEKILSNCETTEMLISRTSASARERDRLDPRQRPATQGTQDPLALWDDNDDGRITCKEARRHKIAPVPRNHPAYLYMHDGDRDGVVCE